MGRSTAFATGSEVYAARVPKGVASLIRAAVRSIELDTKARVDVDVILLVGLLALMKQTAHTEVTEAGIRALEHVIEKRTAN